jgi:hypothetical protein
MGKMDNGMIKEIGNNVEHFAGKTIKNSVMEGSQPISNGTSKSKIAKWIKAAVDKLDSLVDKKTGFQIMEHCGYNCFLVNNGVIKKAKARLKKYKSINEFIEAEIKNPSRGTRLEINGNVLYQFYTPQSFTTPMRCYCSLLRGLPVDEKVSQTYCHCSKGFVKKYWENLFERPVKVDLIESVVSGALECKFAIHL